MSLKAKCPNCGWKLPIIGAKYRNARNKGFECPSCTTHLRYKANAGPLSYIGPGVSFLVILYLSTTDFSQNQVLVLVPVLAVLVIFFLNRESLESVPIAKSEN